MTRESLNEFVKLLNQDAILIPKKILKNDDVYDETKIMFSVILTENRDFINSQNIFPLSELIKTYEDVSVSRIMYECFCAEPKATLIKKEMIELSWQLEDILDIPTEMRYGGNNE
ncbi:MAG: hypothetical protein IJA12_06580 [Oscillospiraceae bacterium]|nr:hypothetical protein [Oscillospiraceae bacterium]